MANVLLVHASLFGEKSESLALARTFLSRYPHRQLVERALAPANVPHLDAETFTAMRLPAAELSAAQKAQVALSDELIAELEAADTIVLAVPMYNFSIPSTLKAWIDHIARAGRTFRYGEQGPEGLLKGKKVFIFVSRGGIYSADSPAAVMNFQEPYLRAVLRFVGLDDVTFVAVEGIGLGAEAAAAGRARGLADVERLTAANGQGSDEAARRAA